MRDESFTRQLATATRTRAPIFVGPVIPSRRWIYCLAAAAVVVLATVALRAMLAPLIGTQAPFLPFMLAVFVSAYLGGFAAGLFATLLTPIAATLWFTTWPHDAPPFEWLAHVLLFVVSALLATWLMHELQRGARAQRRALQFAMRSASQAEQSAAQMRLIADAMPALISYIGTDGKYQFVNRLYESWFGMSRDQLHGRLVSEVLGEQAFQAVRPRLERALGGERVFFEEQIAYATGRREVAVHYIPDTDADGKVLGCFALIEDVAARKRAERTLREADRRKDEFLAILAHELRNPLTPIRNVAHILGKGQPDAQTVRRAGEMLERQATQLTRLVDDLLDVARIMRGRVTLDRAPVDVASVLDTALEAVRPLLENRGQSVVLARGQTGVFVDGDSVRLCQVFTNLLSNASKYSPEGDRIFLAIEATSDMVTVSVRDNGIGMDPQMLPLVFDVFLQGDRTLDRTQDGLGIGLTIVRHLVEIHGGSVEASSDGLGEGSEFCVRLPRIAAPLESQRAESGEGPSAAARCRILVIEDNVDAAESLGVLLRMDGHQVVVTHSGAQALQRLEDFRADIVILDLGLPRVDGFMVAHAIRARFDQLHHRARLLALSGHGRDEDRRSAQAAGFDGHLTKPVEPQKLLRMIADLGQRQSAPSRSD